MLCLVDTTVRQDENNLSNPIMVDEHLQKGERKTGYTQAQSPDWETDMQMPQHLVRWGWRFRAVRRMGEGFC